MEKDSAWNCDRIRKLYSLYCTIFERMDMLCNGKYDMVYIVIKKAYWRVYQTGINTLHEKHLWRKMMEIDWCENYGVKQVNEQVKKEIYRQW